MFSSMTSSLLGGSFRRKSDNASPNGEARGTATALSPADAWRIDWEDARAGFEHLFDDRFEEAERVLGQRAATSPVHAVGYALTACVDALIGFEERAIIVALDRLQAAEKLATDWARRLQREQSNNSAVGGGESAGSAQVAYELLAADCTLLSACLLFMRESLMEYAKGAYRLRSAYKMYCACRVKIYGPQAASDHETNDADADSDEAEAEAVAAALSNLRNGQGAADDASIAKNARSRTAERFGARLSRSGSNWFSRKSSVSGPPSDTSATATPTTSVRGPASPESAVPSDNDEDDDEDDATTLTTTSMNALVLDTAADIDAKGSADDMIIASVSFGVGLFKLALSMLPPRAMRVLSAFGLQGDGPQGLRLLRRATRVNSDMHTPFAALTLLGYHTGLNSFASFAPSLEPSLTEAADLIARMRQRYPNGRLWRLMDGKLSRVRADLPRAKQLFAHETSTSDAGKDAPATERWVQLEHLMDYESAWCHVLMGEYRVGGEMFGQLATCTNWSRAFYAYLHAACLYAVGDSDAASEKLAAIPGLIRKRFGGRLIPAEMFVLRKHREISECPPPAHRAWPALILELVYIWNGFRQQNAPQREQTIAQLQTAESAARDADERAVVQVALGCVLREHGDYDAAFGALTRIDEAEVQRDRYAVIYAWYERAVLSCYRAARSNDREACWREAEDWLRRATEAVDYDFDNRIHLRAQLLSAGMAEARAAKQPVPTLA